MRETRREKQVAARAEREGQSATRRPDGRTETEAAELVAGSAGDGELFAERTERRGGVRITRALGPEASRSEGREDK